MYYISDRASDEQLSDYYASLPFDGWELDQLYPTDRRIMHFVDTLPTGQRILDYGCSIARVSRNWVGDHEVHGFELSAEATRIAAGQGLRMHDDYVGLLSSGERFDLILLMDVFEHLTAPTKLLSELCSLLSDRGRLLVLTGNGDCKACQQNPTGFWYMQILGHVCMLSRGYAEWLAKREGMFVERWEELSHYEIPIGRRLKKHLQWFAYHAHHSPSPTPISRMASAIPLFRKAKHWTGAPALDCTADHVIAVLTKGGQGTFKAK